MINQACIMLRLNQYKEFIDLSLDDMPLKRFNALKKKT